MTERMKLQRSEPSRVGFTLGKRTKEQEPAVLPAEEEHYPVLRMTDEEMAERYKAIQAELIRQDKPLFVRDMPACLEKPAREAARK